MNRKAPKSGGIALLFTLFLLCALDGAAHSGEDSKTPTPPEDALAVGYVELGGERDQFTAEILCAGTRKGAFTSIIPNGRSVPTVSGQVFGGKDGANSISVTFLKGTKVMFEENPVFCRVAVYGVPSEPGKSGLIAVYLYAGSDGAVMVWARNHRTGGKLKVRLLEESTEAE